MDIEGLEGRSCPDGVKNPHATGMVLSVGTDVVDRFIIATPDRVIGLKRRIMQGECGEGETPLVIIPQPCETCENIKRLHLARMLRQQQTEVVTSVRSYLL